MRLHFIFVAVCLLVETASAIKAYPSFKKLDKKHHSCKKHHHKHELKQFNVDIQLYKAGEGVKSNVTKATLSPIRPTVFGVLAKVFFSGAYGEFAIIILSDK